MTREEAYKRTKGYLYDALKGEEANEIIKVLEQKPCEDCISRQAVLDLIDSDWKYEGLETGVTNLPCVTPQPKIGHWIKMPLVETGQTYSHKCSACGRKILTTDAELSKFPYCHCGAKMEEVEE